MFAFLLVSFKAPFALDSRKKSKLLTVALKTFHYLTHEPLH